MENADKVITAYSGLTIPQAIVLGIFLIVIVGVIAWLISSYGLTFKGLTIGGSKKILESSRHDSFLIEDLRIAIEKIDQSLAVDLKLLAKRNEAAKLKREEIKKQLTKKPEEKSAILITDAQGKEIPKVPAKVPDKMFYLKREDPCRFLIA